MRDNIEMRKNIILLLIAHKTTQIIFYKSKYASDNK
jgi:hypothetical protein